MTMADITVEEVADAMYKMLVEYHGKKRFKVGDLQKEMKKQFGQDADRKVCKSAIKLMMEDGRTIYGYAGGSWIEPVVKDEA
jgi:hypothetical protein